MSNLLENIHLKLTLPSTTGKSYLIKGQYLYYHYMCDNFNDKGWGCGYRTLQTLCSWIIHNKESDASIPTIPAIQKILVQIQDKPRTFLESREWIGSVEVGMVIDTLYNVPCKIVHCNSGAELCNITDVLIKHFLEKGSPIMMGGDQDCSSKGVIGIHVDDNNTYLLIVDPHFVGKPSVELLQRDGWVKWCNISEFLDSSFYNLCLPQIS